jgi:hypothetical protein
VSCSRGLFLPVMSFVSRCWRSTQDIRRSIRGFCQADYSRLVDWMNDRMRRSLSRINRDEAARVLWQVSRTSPGSCGCVCGDCLPTHLRLLGLKCPSGPFRYPKVKESERGHLLSPGIRVSWLVVATAAATCGSVASNLSGGSCAPCRNWLWVRGVSYGKLSG